MIAKCITISKVASKTICHYLKLCKANMLDVTKDSSFKYLNPGCVQTQHVKRGQRSDR